MGHTGMLNCSYFTFILSAYLHACWSLNASSTLFYVFLYRPQFRCQDIVSADGSVGSYHNGYRTMNQPMPSAQAIADEYAEVLEDYLRTLSQGKNAKLSGRQYNPGRFGLNNYNFAQVSESADTSTNIAASSTPAQSGMPFNRPSGSIPLPKPSRPQTRSPNTPAKVPPFPPKHNRSAMPPKFPPITTSPASVAKRPPRPERKVPRPPLTPERVKSIQEQLSKLIALVRAGKPLSDLHRNNNIAPIAKRNGMNALGATNINKSKSPNPLRDQGYNKPFPQNTGLSTTSTRPPTQSPGRSSSQPPTNSRSPPPSRGSPNRSRPPSSRSSPTQSSPRSPPRSSSPRSSSPPLPRASPPRTPTRTPASRPASRNSNPRPTGRTPAARTTSGPRSTTNRNKQGSDPNALQPRT